MGRSPHEHDVERAVGKNSRLSLRHVCDTARNLRPWQIPKIIVAERHAPALRRKQAEKGLEERSLAASVGSEQAQHFAWRDSHGDVAPNRSFRITESKIVGRELHHDHPCRPRRSSQRKNGAPTTAVRMPIGTSMPPRDRASVSTSTRYAAPISIAAGRRRSKF